MEHAPWVLECLPCQPYEERYWVRDSRMRLTLTLTLTLTLIIGE